MGGFDKVKELFAKPKSIPDILAEDHPTDWYEKKYDIFLKVFLEYTDEGVDSALKLFCIKYFDSLSNIKELRNNGQEVDTADLGNQLADSIKTEIDFADLSEEDIAKKVFIIGQTFKTGTNMHIRFAKKLNHNFSGESAIVVNELIAMHLVDADEDTWLYDKDLFKKNERDSQDEVDVEL